VTDDEDEIPYWENYESGPYCVHWDYPPDCEEKCKCGHECRKHWCGNECEIEGCSCQQYQDPDHDTRR